MVLYYFFIVQKQPVSKEEKNHICMAPLQTSFVKSHQWKLILSWLWFQYWTSLQSNFSRKKIFLAMKLVNCIHQQKICAKNALFEIHQGIGLLYQTFQTGDTAFWRFLGKWSKTHIRGAKKGNISHLYWAKLEKYYHYSRDFQRPLLTSLGSKLAPYWRVTTGA